MNKKQLVVLGAVYAIAGLLTTGCMAMQKITRAKPAEISPFLEHPERMAKQEATFPFHYFYLKKDAGTYDNVYIAPVNIEYLRKNVHWEKIDQALAAQLGSDIKMLAEYMREELQKSFAQSNGPRSLKVVDSPNHPKTLIVEAAIVAIKPSKAELTILGTAGNLFLPGIGVIANKIAAGSITTECMIRDAKTKEVIAMYANTEKDQTAVLNIAGMHWYTSSKNNIRRQADYTARIFSGNDYTFMYRRLIKIIAL